MRVSIYQPAYWPSLHYFNRILNSDMFVLLDMAQFTRSVRYTNTMKIKGKCGLVNMTVPIVHTGRREMFVNLLADDNQRWRQRHYEALRHAYGKTDGWKMYGNSLHSFYENEESRFSRLCELAVDWVLNVIKSCNVVTVRASSLGIDGNGSQWMLDICKELDATEYLCGKPAYDNYLDKEAFRKAGIKIMVQNWTCMKYKQQGMEFIPNLSILDLIMNVPGGNRKDLLLKTGVKT